MDANQVGRADLPPSAVALLELVVQGFQLRHGPATIELAFQDGGF
jgi:hypothetical protein